MLANSTSNAADQPFVGHLCLSMQHKLRLLRDFWALALVPVAFAAFAVWNGGVVVGDKDHHQAAPHLVQPLYFVLFSAVALYPIHLSPHRWAITGNPCLARPHSVVHFWVLLNDSCHSVQPSIWPHALAHMQPGPYTWMALKTFCGMMRLTCARTPEAG